MSKLKADLETIETSIGELHDALRAGKITRMGFAVELLQLEDSRSLLIVAAYDAGELTSVVPAA
jgi:hypothetical protein